METTVKPRYNPGDRVRVRPDSHQGHHRTPWYIKGKTGTVSAFNGLFFNSETRAYGESGLPKLPLYLVEFDQADVWPEYEGPHKDRILVDLFEHWLEPV